MDKVPDGAKMIVQFLRERQGFADQTGAALENGVVETLTETDFARGLINRFSDDIRRITANWVEYGGGLVPGKAKDRRAKDVNPETVTLHPERAVFDVELFT